MPTTKSASILAAALLLVVSACRSDTAEQTTLPAPAFASATPGDTIVIRGTNQIRFSPSFIQAPPGSYRVRFENVASISHDITFMDGAGAMVAPGEAAEFDLTVPEGGISFICTVAGHFEAGMKGRIFTGDRVPRPPDITRDGFPPPPPDGDRDRGDDGERPDGDGDSDGSGSAGSG